MSDLKPDQEFNIPQRQSSAGILIIMAYTLQKIIRSLAIPLLVILIKIDFGLLYLLGFLAFLAITVSVWAYLDYRRFTFYIDEQHQEFVINKGVINKSNLTIQLSKIQQVNINQSFLQRLVNVYTLEIDTAGSEKKEASIRAIHAETAERLKYILLEGSTSEHVKGDEAEETGVRNQGAAAQPFLKLGSSTLLKIGLTSNYGQTLALIAAFMIAAFEGLKELNDLFFQVDGQEVGHALQRGASIISVCILIGFLLFLVLAINVIRVFLKYYHFSIVKQKNALAITSGLLAIKNTVLNPHKVQLTSFSQNYFQKKLDILDMRMQQDSRTAASHGEEVVKSDIEIPGCSATEKDEILKLIFNGLPQKGFESRANYRFVYMNILFWMVIPVAVLVVMGQYSIQNLQNWYPIILPWELITGTMIFFGYRNHRLYVSENFIIKKSGIWDVQYQILEPHKIQAISTTQMLWHRKNDIGHLHLSTAAGVVTFRFGNFTKINQLVNYWLYQLETSKKEWM